MLIATVIQLLKYWAKKHPRHDPNYPTVVVQNPGHLDTVDRLKKPTDGLRISEYLLQ